MRRRGTLLAAVGLGVMGCASEEPVAAVVAYPERSLSYAPLLLAVKRKMDAAAPMRVALAQLSAPGAVARVVVSGEALAGAMGMPDFVANAAAGAPLVAMGALTSRLDSHLVTTTARGVPDATLAAIHGGAWRGLRVGVESGPDGTEAFVRMFAAWSGARPAGPRREVAALSAMDGETRWSAFETDEGLAAALADRRLEAFVGRAYAAAQTLSYGSGAVAPRPAAGDEEHVLAALPTVLVTRRGGLTSEEEGILRRLRAGIGAAVGELTGPDGKQAVMAALPEKDSLHVTLAHGLFTPSAAASAYAREGRLADGAAARYVELSAMAGARLDVNVGALTTTRFSG